VPDRLAGALGGDRDRVAKVGMVARLDWRRGQGTFLEGVRKTCIVSHDHRALTAER